MRRKPLVFLISLMILFAVTSQCMAAGRYVLAFWREMSCTEVGGCSGGGGTLIMRVWVFNESGLPMPNVRIFTAGSSQVGQTQPDGSRVDIPMDVNVDSYQLKCGDLSGSSSDLTPVMTTRRWPNWGHYSYEMAFMYKSDDTNPGTYDTSIAGTVNTSTDYDTDAPCTRSLAYYSNNPLDWYGSQWALPSGSLGWGEIGQTFVATGNRIMQAEFHGVTGGNNAVDWTVEIRDGGPDGPVIGSRAVPVHFSQDPWCVSFPVTGSQACEVIPGHTYFARIYRPGGLNAYYVTTNNYASGQSYFRTDSLSPWVAGGYPEVWGFITCMDCPTIHITSGPSVVDLTPMSARVIWTTDAASTGRIDYGPTTTYGSNQTDDSLLTDHSFTLTSLVPGSTYHYKIRSTRTGYISTIPRDYTFTLPSVTDSIPAAKALPNGSAVGLVGKVATAGTSQIGGAFYIEEPDRSGGVKVVTTSAVDLGDTVSIGGTVDTTGAETVIDATGVQVTSTGGSPAKPAAVRNSWIGGSDIPGGTGAGNIGLLVRTWGRVTLGSGCFYLNDGFAPTGGIKVLTANLSNQPADGDYVAVTGIASVDGGPVLIPRVQSDLTILMH